MRVDAEEIRSPLLAMKSIHGVPDAEIMFCRPGIPLVKTEDFFTFDQLKLPFMDLCHPACFLRQSEKLISLISMYSVIISSINESRGHKSL